MNNDSAFPRDAEIHYTDHVDCIHQSGLTKLEYAAIKIFCAMINSYPIEKYELLRKESIDQAKLLLKELEDESK